MSKPMKGEDNEDHVNRFVIIVEKDYSRVCAFARVEISEPFHQLKMIN